MANFKKTLMPEQAEALFKILQERFTKNMDRHENLEWQKLRVKLEEHPEKMWSLNAMEETGGEMCIRDRSHPLYIYLCNSFAFRRYCWSLVRAYKSQKSMASQSLSS